VSPSPTVCLTVDVEDWYDGMAVLGEPVPKPPGARSGLTGLAELLATRPDATATLFVVGSYVGEVAGDLAPLAAAGHEVASHGPDHGRLPEAPAALVDWLRRGREGLEDSLGVPVVGFRSPRFDVPASLPLAAYRHALAEAGYAYVTDTRRLGAASPVAELPVHRWHGYPLGGGSYQRLLPAPLVEAGVASPSGGAAGPTTPGGATGSAPVVLYYHSYDFGATLPATSSIRSLAVAKQLVGRGRVAGLFASILSRFGSQACAHVQR
jgi:Polysaccharide deacetylase